MEAFEIANKAREIGQVENVSGEFINAMTDRLEGIGADQYEYIDDNGTVRQNFENESLVHLLRGMQEELVDAANYAVMAMTKYQGGDYLGQTFCRKIVSFAYKTWFHVGEEIAEIEAGNVKLKVG